MLKSGLGWRSLKHPFGGIKTTTGANGYDRIQEYRYVPFLAEIKMPISSIDVELKLEYDHVFYGYNSSEQGHLSGNRDLNFRNDDGYMVKAAYKIPYESIYLEPYYEFHSIEESTVESGSVEPSNTTDEYGIKVTQKFGENKLTSIPKAKRKNITGFKKYKEFRKKNWLIGSSGRTRTCDQLINSQLLYQLSYRGITSTYFFFVTKQQ